MTSPELGIRAGAELYFDLGWGLDENLPWLGEAFRGEFSIMKTK